MNVNSPGWSTAKRKATPFTPLNLATVGLIVAWLTFACYALAYLISH
jgi:hypothetical protein